MKNLSTKTNCRGLMTIVPTILVSFLIMTGLIFPSSAFAQQGVAPTVEPVGGCAIDGNLLARTPDSYPFSPDNGDFLPNENAPGSGGYVFTLAGVPVDTTTAFHIIDEYDAADMNIFTNGSKFNQDPNEWDWKAGKPPAKDDMNNVMFFFSSDTLGNIWFVGSGDRKRTKGNTYLDFELLQNPLYMNDDSTFTSLGPDSGRTIGDLVISITYTNGGTEPELFLYRWDSTGQGEFGYVLEDPADGTTFLAVNIDSAIVVPYGAYGTNTYEESAFTEVACNLNELFPDTYACMNISTVIAKTKASQSINAALKDCITPVQVDVSSAPVVSLDDVTICFGDTATLTATVVSGTGPYTYLWSNGDTSQTIYVSPDTTTQYSVVVTGINGCPSDTAYATVTVLPLPPCDITGPDTLCPLGTDQYTGPDTLSTYAWTIYGAASIIGDTSGQVIDVQGNGTCDTSFVLELVVTGPNGCSSSCTKTVYVIDTDSPVFSFVPDSLSVMCASVVPVASIDSVTITDNCAGNLMVTVTDSITNDSCPNQFNILRTWTATDTCGNVSTASQYITVFDSIPPVLYGVPADTGVCCADSVPPPANVTAIDSCDGAVDVELTEVVSDSTSPFYFTLTRIWNAYDTCNNMVSDTQVIIVNDTLYPAGSGMVLISDKDNIILYFKATPNPFSSSTNIQFSLVKDNYVSVELYNYTGVKLRTIFNGNVSAETNISFPLSPDTSMGPGIYLLVIRTTYGVETRRIIFKR